LSLFLLDQLVLYYQSTQLHQYYLSHLYSSPFLLGRSYRLVLYYLYYLYYQSLLFYLLDQSNLSVQSHLYSLQFLPILLDRCIRLAQLGQLGQRDQYHYHHRLHHH
jgi:hypothetical protein